MKGLSISSFDLNGTSYPWIYGGDAVNYTAGSDPETSGYCLPGYMNSYKVEGTIVLCDTLRDGSGIPMANGIGTVIADSYYSDYAYSCPLPPTIIRDEDGIEVMDYIKTSE